MRVMLAPDSFKGSLSAVEVADTMEKAVLKQYEDVEFEKIPLADGGEGTVDALIVATGGEKVEVEVSDPLGRQVKSFFGVLGDGETGVIEMAAASGLPLLKEEERNPLLTTTYGTGELIKAALDRGCSKLIVGIGGSATNDGGMGMARALGVRFLDANGKELKPGGAALLDLQEIDISGIDERIKNVRTEVACDVDNPLCGPRGASAIYGPQKGASPQDVEVLDGALANYAEVLKKRSNIHVKDIPGAGAAGGLGAGLLAFLNGNLKPGIDIILQATRFSEKVRECHLVLTGEGKIDEQTAFGKAPVGVAREAKKFNLPVIGFAGVLGEKYQNVYDQGIDVVLASIQEITDLSRALENADSWLFESVERAVRLIKIGNIIRED